MLKAGIHNAYCKSEFIFSRINPLLEKFWLNLANSPSMQSRSVQMSTQHVNKKYSDLNANRDAINPVRMPIVLT